MTDPDNLRDRIADVLEMVGNAWDAQMMASIVDDKCPPTQNLADTQAQAIIDELRTDEAVARLANFLHNDDVGETLNEHEESCRIPDCNERDLYAEYAHAAINALLGEEPCPR